MACWLHRCPYPQTTGRAPHCHDHGALTRGEPCPFTDSSATTTFGWASVVCTTTTLLRCGTSEFVKAEIVAPHAICHVIFLMTAKLFSFHMLLNFKMSTTACVDLSGCHFLWHRSATILFFRSNCSCLEERQVSAMALYVPHCLRDVASSFRRSSLSTK